MLDLHHRGDRTDQERAYCTDSGLYDRVVWSENTTKVFCCLVKNINSQQTKCAKLFKMHLAHNQHESLNSPKECDSLEVFHNIKPLYPPNGIWVCFKHHDHHQPISTMSVAAWILMTTRIQMQENIFSYRSTRFNGLRCSGRVMTSLSDCPFSASFVSVCILCASRLCDMHGEPRRPSLQWLLWNIFRISIQFLNPSRSCQAGSAPPSNTAAPQCGTLSNSPSPSSAALAVFVLARSTWPSISLLQLAWLGSKIARVGSVIDSNWPLREESGRHTRRCSMACVVKRTSGRVRVGVFVYPDGSLCSLKMRAILQANNVRPTTVYKIQICCFTPHERCERLGREGEGYKGEYIHDLLYV